MKNYYRKSKKEFKRFVKQNPYCTREEWDNYAHKNYLFSSFTLESHELPDNTMKIIEKENMDSFEYLKETFIIIPRRYDLVKRLFNIKLKKRVKENGR